MIKKLTALGAVSALSIAAVVGVGSVQATDETGNAIVSQDTTQYFTISGALTQEQRDTVADIGVTVEILDENLVYVGATPRQTAKLREAGLNLTEAEAPAAEANRRVEAVEAKRVAEGKPRTTSARDFPAGDEAFHTYDEVNSELRDLARRFPDRAKLFNIGESYEGRTIYGLKISDNVNKDEKEPEVVMNCNVHAREHLTAEMCMYAVNEFTRKYDSDRRIKKIVDSRVLWIIPMMNPDGVMHDIASGRYVSWRKNRQPGRRYIGTDMNRNFAWEWGGTGASPDEDSDTYRGTRPESAPEVRNLANFVRSRKVNGEQRVKAHLDWHSYSELVLWPFGYTRERVVPGMTDEEATVYETIGKKMGASNNYKPMQSSDLYPAAGDSSDWFWGDQKIWSVTMEMFPKGRRPGFYPSARLIPRETKRNRDAMLMWMEAADCMWRVVGKEYKCPNPDNGNPGDGNPGDGNPGDGNPGDGNPGDGNPGDGNPGDAFTNNERLEIRNYRSVQSSVNSTVTSARKLNLAVKVDHRCANHLRVDMQAPNGRWYNLQRGQYASGSSCNAWSGVTKGSWDVSLRTEGKWTLKLTDEYGGASGVLNGWTLSFD